MDLPHQHEEEEEDNKDLFLKISDEIILKILSHFDVQEISTRISRINKRFHRLALDSSLWIEVHLSGEKRGMLDLWDSCRMIERCCKMRRLSIGSRRDSSFLAMRALEQCPNLEQLHIPVEDHFFPSLLKAIGSVGHSLRTLELHRDWNARSFNPSAQYLKNLTSLVLRDADKGLDTEGLKAIGDHCKKLEVLEIHWARNLNDEAMNYFLDRVCGTIRSLNINGTNLSEKSLKNLCMCHSLQRLTVFEGSPLCSVTLDSISSLYELEFLDVNLDAKSKYVIAAFQDRKMEKLKRLDLGGCQEFNDKCLITLANNCKELTYLKLPMYCKVTDFGLTYALKNCLKLEELDIQNVPNVSSAAFKHMRAPLKCLIMDGKSKYCGSRKTFPAKVI